MAAASTAEWFPSEEWLAAYRANLNDSERYREESEGWGVDFEGDFLFEIRDLPVEETTLGEFPDGLTDPLRENLRSLPDDRIDRLLAEMPEVVWPELREEFPDDLDTLLEQLERYVEDGTVRVYLDLHDGSVTTIMGYADAADEMGAVASRTPSTPLFEAQTALDDDTESTGDPRLEALEVYKMRQKI